MHNLSGEYVVKLDGEEIARSKNVITDSGRSTIKKYLIGSVPVWGSSIGIGVVSTTATTSDTRLKFEADRRSITSKTIYRPKNYLSSVVVSGTNTAVFTTVENNKFAVNDVVTVAGVTGTNATALNASHTVTAVGTNSFTIVKTGLTNGTTAINATAIGEELILLKATFPDSLAVRINEIGVYPAITNLTTNLYNVELLSDFSESDWGTFGSSTSLIGSSNLTATTTTKTISNVSMSFDGYISTDKVALLVNNPTASAKTVTVTFTNSAGATKAYSFTSTTATGSQVIEVDVGYNTLGTVYSMSVASTANIDLDAISLVSIDGLGVSNYIVSRSALASTIVKAAGQQLEIEYSMRLG
jgi:hypothetical protein